ncbi:MAG: hypothetical protein D6702_06440 [Planctomycetota bacterium]|nr:MAG: hypothetical protein D6702_06440 [Planctomycetota bacterium]
MVCQRRRDGAGGVTAAGRKASQGVGPVSELGPDWGVRRAVIFLLACTALLAAAQNGDDGYTLFAPLQSTTTYLIDSTGRVVHRWESEYRPGHAVYLLDDGSILRCGRSGDNEVFHGGGEGGRIQRIAWDGELLWDFSWSDESHLQHHDIEPMPDGSVLVLSWELRSREEALAAGRDPAGLPAGELWPDAVFQIVPEGRSGGRVVWEWHAWDHLVQDRDPDLPGYGVVAEHPEKIDLNFGLADRGLEEDEIAGLAGLGYVDDPGAGEDDRPPASRAGFQGADWMHTNAIDYHPERDQILLSVRNFHEIWIIDHGTTSEEAAGPAGDLLYRWGNPAAYGVGTAADQRLFGQHDARWIEEGRPGAGHVLLFNNGAGRADGNWSSVDELELPWDGAAYRREGPVYGPRRLVWRYRADDKESFFSGHISGAERLADGNTLICSGEEGRIFEVDPAGTVVWEYSNPFGEAPGRRGPGGRPGGPPPRGRRGPPPGPPGRPGGGGRGGPGRGNEAKALFRATRIEAGHPGLARLAEPAAVDGVGS